MTIRRAALGTLLALVLIALGVGIGWSARVLLTPPPTEEAPDWTTVAVTSGSLGRTQTFRAAATWPTDARVSTLRVGTLTSLPGPADGRLEAGELLATVDLAQVRVLPGAVPAFRDMEPGTQGEDVAQLQRHLFAHYGTGTTANGTYGPFTAQLVRRWQKDLGMPVTGVVARGDVLFIPALPAVVRPHEGVAVGDLLTEGAALADIASTVPRVAVPVRDRTSTPLSTGVDVTVRIDGRTWEGRVTSIEEDPLDGTATALIGAREGERICGEECDLIPPQGRDDLSVEVVEIPEQEGALVPVSALRVNASGATVLIDEAGAPVPVQVRVSVGGRAIVDGVDVGTRVRVWGKEVDVGSGGTTQPETGTGGGEQTPEEADTGAESGRS